MKVVFNIVLRMKRSGLGFSHRARPALRVALVLAAALPAGCRRDQAAGGAPAAVHRLVSVGGSVTETVFALGAGAQLLGVDTSSVYPPEATRLPKVGYQRTFSVEGVLGLRPTLVLLGPDAGPPAAIAQLREAGVRVHQLPEGHSAENARAKIRQLGGLLGKVAEAEALVQRLDRDLDRARALAAARRDRPGVLFIYARGAGAASVSGRGTSAATIVELAGGRNTVDSFEGFRPLTAESAIAAAPEVIVMPARGMDSVGGKAGLLQLPGISATPAARAGRIVTIDDLALLGVGPRMGEAALALATALAQIPVAATPMAGGAAPAAGDRASVAR
jgi:iron complex transport system substrate-binding protein